MLGLELSERGTLKVDRTTLATNVEGVFAGGDAIEVNSSVVEAVGTGHEASISIDRYIHGQDLKEGRDKLKQTAPKPEKVVEALARIQEPQIALETHTTQLQTREVFRFLPGNFHFYDNFQLFSCN